MRAANQIGKGSEAYAMHVKGLEMPGYEPRGSKSQGFNYATSSIGASHCYGYARQEIFGVPYPREVDRFAEEENADIVVFNQNGTAMREVGIVCNFASGWGWMPTLFGKMLAAVTGIEQFEDIDYLNSVGERIVNMERAFIVREGFTRKDDTFPIRITNEPLLTRGAPGEGQIVRNLDGNKLGSFKQIVCFDSLWRGSIIVKRPSTCRYALKWPSIPPLQCPPGNIIGIAGAPEHPAY
jgi:aldehyde:ferredoxin oxidoreductase